VGRRSDDRVDHRGSTCRDAESPATSCPQSSFDGVVDLRFGKAALANVIEHGLSGESEVSGHEQQIHSRFEGENDDLFIRRRVPHPSHRQRVGHDEAFMPELVAQRARNDGSDRVAGAPSGSRPGKARCPVMITGTRHR
jgi:hypothetical protein